MARRSAEKKAERMGWNLAFAAFLVESGESQQSIADDVTAKSAGPEGKEVTRKLVWNYANKTPMPDWFKDYLDKNFAGWMDYKKGTDSRRTTTESSSIADRAPRADMPLISSIEDESSLSEMVEAYASDHWKKVRSAPDFLKSRFPIQIIKSNAYAPAFEIGDAVGLVPTEDPRQDSLHLVVDDKGARHYAALLRSGGHRAWTLYDGSTLTFERCSVKALVVALIFGFSDTAEVGAFNREGLLVPRQVLWPRS